MKVSIYWKASSFLLVGLLVFGLSAAALRPTEAAPGDPLATQGPVIVVRADYTASTLRVPPPSALFALGAESATITVNYSGSWSSEAQTAFQYAVDIWETQINSSVPIVVNASWESLGSGVLGSAGAYSWHRDFTGAPVAGTWYPAGLASALAGSDVNDVDGYDHDGVNGDVDAEIRVRLNSDFADWYFGTDGNTPSNKWDMVTVVLHELCHGLGFAGSMQVSGGYGSWGSGTAYPFIYDRFTENGSGQQLITAFPNNSTELATQLQGGDLFFDGPNANAANGGQQPEIYAPSTWVQGSSYSHLDEIFNNTPNALMTYSVSNGESVHAPGPIVLGVYEDIGWSLPQQEYPDVSIEKAVVGGDFQPGDPITFTLSIGNVGDAVASQVVVTDSLPSEVTSPSFASTLVITPVGGTTYVWNVESLAVGESGVITIYGQIDPGLGANFSFANTATIGDPQDQTPGNNSSSVIVGESRVYLPLVMKRYPPIPYTPVLNAISNPDGDGNFTVDWEPADLADSYVLEEDDNASFSSPTVRYNGASTSWKTTGKTTGTYYYRVRAVNTWGNSSWSDTRGITAFNWIRNADFEAGQTDWMEFSTHGWDLIVTDFPGTVTPHSGMWAVWLGGDYSDISYIEQRVTVPPSRPILAYWHWIASEDVCGYDFGGVIVNGSTVVSVYDLCQSSSTGGWVQHALDLSSYAGQTIDLQVRAETDGSLNSNLFVDDVSFYPASLLVTGEQGVPDARNAVSRTGEDGMEGKQPLAPGFRSKSAGENGLGTRESP